MSFVNVRVLCSSWPIKGIKALTRGGVEEER